MYWRAIKPPVEVVEVIRDFSVTVPDGYIGLVMSSNE